VNGVAVVVGQTVICPEADARLLIGLGKAIAIEDEPQSPAIETADAEPPAMESTVARRPKGKSKAS